MLGRAIETIQKLFRNPVFPWVAAFWLGCLIVPQHGCQLELPRMLTLRAMADDQSFEIGRYIDWTDEWARTPDGRYFNNRAPGPGFVGFPLFFLVDRTLVRWREGGKVDDKGRRPWPGHLLRASLSFSLQQLPFGILVMLGATMLLSHGVPIFAVHFFALAALFGNTASIFMNSYSGHGLAATFVLGLLLALLSRRYFWVGLAFGFALLTDYGAAMLLLPLLAALFLVERDPRKWALAFVAGGLLPGVLWVWYHLSAFGSPFLTANHFQNPMYQDVRVDGNFMGIFKPWPDFKVLGELLLGARRGLLPTQPWALLFLPLSLLLLARFEKPKSEAFAGLVFTSLSFVLLLWLNSMYGGWFAGLSAGPRYLSQIIPAIAFMVAVYFTRIEALAWGRAWTKLLWVSLAAALVFRGLVFAVNPMAPLEPLWGFYWQAIVGKETLTNWFRLGIYFVLLGLALGEVIRRSKQGTNSAKA
jgi:hypothetical protein